METGRNVFTIDYVTGRFKEYEKKILAHGACRAFLPVSFVNIDGTEQVSYDCSGYLPVARYEIKSSSEMVDILEKCAFALIIAGEHLLNPKKIRLTPETVYYSAAKREVRMAYTPRETAAEKPQSVFVEFLESFRKNISNNEMQRYLSEIFFYTGTNNGSFFDIINYLEELKAEIHACE